MYFSYNIPFMNTNNKVATPINHITINTQVSFNDNSKLVYLSFFFVALKLNLKLVIETINVLKNAFKYTYHKR